MGAKETLYICLVFWRLQDLVAYIFWTKRDVDKDGQGRWKVQEVPYIVPKFHEVSLTNGLQ